jgi:FtsH-binding integral membrane protein
MRSTGAIVLSFFGALWAFLALHNSGQPLWAQIMPFVLSFALVLAALNSDRHAQKPTPEMRKRIGRTVMIWSFIEGVAIFAVVNVLHNTGHAEWTVALVAVVVGLHFFPLAIGLRAPIYWLTGVGLLAVAAAGLVMVRAGVAQDAAIGIGCAVVLYVTAFVITAFTPKARVMVEA